MNEADIKSALVALLRKELLGAVVFRHEDKMTAGIPDISVTWRGRTTWWEVKLKAPRLISSGVQELTVLRLSAAGNAKYIVYTEEDKVKRVGIIEPRQLTDLGGLWEAGWNHGWVVEQIRRAHYSELPHTLGVAK